MCRKNAFSEQIVRVGGNELKPGAMESAAKEMLSTEADAARISRAKAHLDLEKQRITQLLSMLSDYSTQGALLAGAAISAVGGESMDSFDDERAEWWRVPVVALFMVSGATALGTSLWVIFISSHLSSLTRDSTMRPKIIEGRRILEKGVQDVRGMQWLAMASLLATSLTSVWLNSTSTFNSIVFSAVLLAVVMQALAKKEQITNTFREECGATWAQADDLGAIFRAFTEPLVHFCCVPKPPSAPEAAAQSSVALGDITSMPHGQRRSSLPARVEGRAGAPETML